HESRVTRHRRHSASTGFHEGGAVGRIREVAGERVAENGREERLGSLDRDELLPRQCLDNLPVPDTLDRVRKRQSGHGSVPPLVQRRQHPSHHFVRKHGTSRIVDDDHGRLVSHFGHAGADRLGSRLPPATQALTFAQPSHSAASSSSMSLAYINSLARIFFALTNICFSPVERPFSWSRSERFRTTSASSKMSPVFILSRLCLKRRFQFLGIWVPPPV